MRVEDTPRFARLVLRAGAEILSGSIGGGEEEGQDAGEAVGPGVFSVGGVGDGFEVEVSAGGEAELDEVGIESLGVADVAGTFGCADIEPDADGRTRPGAGDDGEDGALVPPDGRGEDGKAGEDGGVLEAKEEGDEAAE